MKVFVNNTAVETAATHLEALIAQLALPADGVAAGLNGRIVPRAERAATPLGEGDRLVIIKAACGG